jgi:diadenosine tetraphosphate (Ap4A) HIT family hydrolase
MSLMSSKICFKPDKLNIGALGNMVPQLHIHIICRFEDDRAWPNAIWGTPAGEDEAKIAEYKAKIKVRL